MVLHRAVLEKPKKRYFFYFQHSLILMHTLVFRYHQMVLWDTLEKVRVPIWGEGGGDCGPWGPWGPILARERPNMSLIIRCSFDYLLRDSYPIFPQLTLPIIEFTILTSHGTGVSFGTIWDPGGPLMCCYNLIQYIDYVIQIIFLGLPSMGHTPSFPIVRSHSKMLYPDFS